MKRSKAQFQRPKCGKALATNSDADTKIGTHGLARDTLQNESKRMKDTLAQ